MNKALFVFMAVSLPLLASVAYAKRLQPEKWYQEQWCTDGEVEYTLLDNTRCDCLTATHAIEFDFANKWAEAIGQALYYSAETGKAPGVVLIMEREEDSRYLPRIQAVIEGWNLPIRLWLTGPAVAE